MKITNNIRDRVHRRIGRSYGNYICSRQQNPLRGYPKTIVTTFYDFEGDYAMPNQTGPSLEAVKTILEVEARYNIRSTYNTVAKYAQEIPEIISEIDERGHELASHSVDHSVLTTLPASKKIQNIREARSLFQSMGVAIRGHRSPQSSWDHKLMRYLLSEGYQWNAENGGEPHPYIYMDKNGDKLWRFPIRDDDWAYQAERLTPSEMLLRWQSVVNEGRVHKQYTAIGFHPWVEHPEGRLEAFEEFMRWLSLLEDVEVMPFGSVYDLIQGRIESTKKLSNSNVDQKANYG